MLVRVHAEPAAWPAGVPDLRRDLDTEGDGPGVRVLLAAMQAAGAGGEDFGGFAARRLTFSATAGKPRFRKPTAGAKASGRLKVTPDPAGSGLPFGRSEYVKL